MTDMDTTELLLPKFLVLGHGAHGKGTFCRLLKEYHGLTSLSSSRVALPYVYPSLKEAMRAFGGEPAGIPEITWRTRHQYRDLWKELISLLNTPDKTTLSRLILEQAHVYDGMRDADEFKASRHLFDKIFWVDGSERKPADSSMHINYEDTFHYIDNNGTIEDLIQTVKHLRL